MAQLNAQRSLVAVAMAGIGASVCCVGPLVLPVPGISGAWIGKLRAPDPCRPVFTGLTLQFLVLAFRELYLVPRGCTPENACAEPRVMRRQRLTFRMVAALPSALLVVPVLVPMVVPLFYR